MGFLSILIYLVIIFFVLEIAMEILIISGLKRDIARFQVISMMTATGFTTKESELILRHPVRRQVAIFLILFGVFSLAVIISMISSLVAEKFHIRQLASVMIVLGLVTVMVKNKIFERKMTQKFHKYLQKEFDLHELPVQEFLYLSDKDLITAIQICEDSTFIHKKAGDIFPVDEDINLLFINRGGVKIRSGRMELELQAGDELFLYGLKKEIEGKFKLEMEQMEKKLADETNAAALN